MIEILETFDLGDEIGRKNLKSFIANVLSARVLEEHIVKKLVRCTEKIITNSDARLQFFVDIVRSYIDPNNTIDFSDQNVVQVIESIKDPSLKVKVSALKLEILDLKEQETTAFQDKDYANLERITEELIAKNEELIRLLSELESMDASQAMNSFIASFAAKKPSTECLQQCLQICYYAVASKETKTLTPSVVQLYKDFIRRQIESKVMSLRDWALRCSVACSMLYEQLVKDSYNELTAQFYKHHITRIWITAISGTFELIDFYGFAHFEKIFENKNPENNPKKTRQLFNKLEYLNDNEEEEDTAFKAASDLMYLFCHFLDTCEEASIIRALITGFCRLALMGHFISNELISKLIIKYFCPATDHEVNQVLGIFFETLVKRRQQECLAKALLLSVNVILDAPNDSPLQEIKPETVIKFVINATLPQYCAPGLNIHNDIAVSFLSVMKDSLTNKELLKLLSKEMLGLVLTADPSLRSDLEQITENILNNSIDPKTEGYIKSFKDLLAGRYKRPSTLENEDEDGIDDDTDRADTDIISPTLVDNSGVIEKSKISNSSNAELETSEIASNQPYQSMPLTPPEETAEDLNMSGLSSDEENRVTSTQKSQSQKEKEKEAEKPKEKEKEPQKKKATIAKAKANSKDKTTNKQKSTEDDENVDNDENDEIPCTPTEVEVSYRFYQLVEVK